MQTADSVKTALSDNQYSIETTEDGFTFSLVPSEFTDEELNTIASIVISYYTEVDVTDLPSDTVVTYKNDVTAWGKTASVIDTYTIKNDTRIDKTAAGDSNVELEDLDTETITIDGVPTLCYLLKWQVTLNENGDYTSTDRNLDVYKFVDTLPDGYSLYTDASSSQEFYLEYYDTWGYKQQTVSPYNDENKWNSVTYEIIDNQVEFNIRGWCFASGKQVYLYYVTYIPVGTLDEQAVVAKEASTVIQVTNQMKDEDDVSDEATILRTP
jgi:hypothetical protein